MFCVDSLWLRETCSDYDEILEVKEQSTTYTKPNWPGRSLWLRETSSDSDEILEVEQRRTTDTKPNRSRRVKYGGHGFETQMAAVIGLRRAKRWENSKLFSNTKDASSVFVSCTKGLVATGINFVKSEISRFKTELSNKRSVHLRSDALALCRSLLMNCLPVSECIFVNLKSLQSDKSRLLHAWLRGSWQWCVVFCDSDNRKIHISNTCLNMFSIMKPLTSNKCLIILTPFSVQQIPGFSPVNHKFKFNHLSKKSQEMVLDKKVDFQGRYLRVKSILNRHGIVKHDLAADVVSRLVTTGTVKLGGTLLKNSGYYAPRVLEREVWLQLDVLKNRDLYPDMFAVSGIEVEDLAVIVPVGETVEYVDQQNTHHIDFRQEMPSRFIVLSEADAEICFLELRKTLVGRTLHWVQFNNGKVLWKKTHGDPHKLLNYIDTKRTRLHELCAKKYMRRGTCEVSEDSIWYLGERAVLVVAEAGMGKSSTTTQVAWNTRKRDPTSWVVRINWNDHTKKLQEIDAATFNFDSLVEFLCSATFRKSQYKDLNMILLKQALLISGNITVLVDGFDEISLIHAYKAAVILSELMKTKVGRVWVTSRPVGKERLEKKLSVVAFSMKKLSHESQVRTFQNLAKCLPKKFKQKSRPLSETNNLCG